MAYAFFPCTSVDPSFVSSRTFSAYLGKARGRTGSETQSQHVRIKIKWASGSKGLMAEGEGACVRVGWYGTVSHAHVRCRLKNKRDLVSYCLNGTPDVECSIPGGGTRKGWLMLAKVVIKYQKSFDNDFRNSRLKYHK